MTRREQALTELAAAGAVFARSGDVAELKRSIVAQGQQQPTFGPRSQCFGKRRYASEQAAARVAKIMSKPDIESYRCPHCGFWHNGHARRA